MTEIDDFVRVFKGVVQGRGDPNDPFQIRLMAIVDETGGKGFTAPDLFEALVGREITKEEDDRLILELEDMEGSA
jgi:hypothetical protein